MKLVRHKSLSQFVDTENIYKNMTLLSELFMFTNDYFLFIKKTTTNDVQMTKESFTGDFETLKIPFQTWGLQVTEQTLLKHYYFQAIKVNIICFKINSIQYITIIEDEDEQMAIYIDNTDDSLSMDFIYSSCPLVSTSLDTNQTIHSFNNLDNGTDSAILYNTSIDQTNYNDLTYQSINDVLSSMTLTPVTFNLLITEDTYRLQTYSMTNEIPVVYIKNLTLLNTNIFNQSLSNQTQLYTLDSTSLQSYIEVDMSNILSLVTFNNNSLIYFNKDTSEYIYKNIFAHHLSGFDSTEIFDITQTRYNLAKEIIKTFVGVDDLSNYKIGKIYSTSNIFIDIESNIGTNTSSLYKSLTTYFEEVNPTLDTIITTNEESPNSSVFNSQYYINSIYQIDLQSDNFTDVNLNNRYQGVLDNMYSVSGYISTHDYFFDTNSILVTPKLGLIDLTEYTLSIEFKCYFEEYYWQLYLKLYLFKNTISNGMSRSDLISNGSVGSIIISKVDNENNSFFGASLENLPDMVGYQYSVKILVSNNKQLIYFNDVLYAISYLAISNPIQYIGIAVSETRVSNLFISKKKMSLTNI